jgi:hypothetical protein
LQPFSPIEGKGMGDSGGKPPTQATEVVAGILVPSMPLAEEDSSSSTNSPIRTVVEDAVIPINLHYTCLVVESDTAKRVSLEL